jgi:DNA polymerase III subunit epsilon
MYLVIDCETTGLPKNWRAPISDLGNWPRVIEAAWSLFDKTGQLMESEVHLIQPDGFTIPADAWRIHGITTERAQAEGKKLNAVLSDLSAAAEKTEVIVAHNLRFDESVISAEYCRLNLEPPFTGKKLFCTMIESTNFCRIPGSKGYKWPALSELYWQLFKSQYEEAHEAGADVSACAKCFFELKRLGVISI